MRKIKVAFVDFPGPANPAAILRFLRRRYDVQIDVCRPDYVFFSVFGRDFLKYPEAVRIFFTGENVHPDFNLADYAFGFDWMNLEDRYCRCPNYQIYPEFEELRARGRTDIANASSIFNRPRFCNFIYSNAAAHPFRGQLFTALSRYRTIDSAGILYNNVGFAVGSPSLGDAAVEDKIVFQRGCKFTIACENSSSIGYTTEKLVHALAADTIPIYWGNPAVGREFNTERFINCHDFESIDAVIDRVRELDRNEERFCETLAKPFFPHGKVPEALSESVIEKQFSHIFDCELSKARRRNRHVWGRRYEDERRTESEKPSLRRWWTWRMGLLKRSIAARVRGLFRIIAS